MIKNKRQNTIRRGGKLFRLFLFALILPFFGNAQFKLEFSKGLVSVDYANHAMNTEITASITNTGDFAVDSITWVYWPNAYKSKGTNLANEFLEDQSGKMRFADRNNLGEGLLLWRPSDGENVAINESFSTNNEVFKMALKLAPGESKTVTFTAFLYLPNAMYNGYGFSENSIQLSHWLPEICADQNKPVTNSKNRESWTVPATYDFVLQSSSPVKCISNLEIKSDAAQTTWRIKSTMPTHDVALVLLKNASTVEMNVDVAVIKLYFSGDYPPFNQPTSWQRISAFLLAELDYVPLENPQFVFINKKGLQSAGNLYFLDATTNQEDLEGDIVEQIVSVITREKLSINPAKHPWLVAGLANYYKDLYFQKYYPDKKLFGPFAQTAVAKFFDIDHYPVRYQNRMLFLYMSRQGLDQPLSDATNNYSRANREAVIKGKSSMVFSYMRNYTGERNFKRSMKYWLQNASGENGPSDLVDALRYYHNKDMYWFLGDIYSTNKKLDYKLKKTENCSSVYTATVKNKGALNIPFPISGYKNGEPLLTEWIDGFAKKKTIQIHLEEYEKVKIDAQESLPEYTQKNNTVRTSGIFKNMQPLKLQFYTSFENPNKTQIFWLPSVKFNAYDKVLIGAQFYNTNLFRKPFEYKISPEYSTGTGSLTGSGSFRFNWIPNSSTFHLISFGVYAKYYHYAENLAYTRFSPTLTFNFKKSSPRSEWIRTLRLRTVAVDREEPFLAEDGAPVSGPSNYQVVDFQYKAEKGSLLNPIIALADVQFAQDFAKISGEFKQRWRFSKYHILTARFFAGLMFSFEETPDPYFQYGLSGTRDYMFDYYFIGRSDQSGIWSQQFFITDGGFKSATGVFDDKGMMALNVNVPFFRFVGAFGDVAMYSQADAVAWDYGLYLEFIPDFFEIYFPFQNNFGTIIDQPNYATKIRFVLNLELDAILNRVRRGFY